MTEKHNTVHSIASVLFLALCLLGSAACAGESKWIWTNADAEPANDPQYVRVAFDLADDAAKATLSISCDNIYVAFVNGKQVGSGNEWHQPGVYDVAAVLVKGKNVLAAQAQNQGGAAGLLADLSGTLKNGSKFKIVTDKNWVFSAKKEMDWATPAFDATAWKKCVELGNWDMAPWRMQSWGNAGASPADTGAPPDPEIERASFQVADGFEINLFAADPMLAKPIQMNWDAQGRLWVVSSSLYPMIKPGEKANDKVIVLEDTKGEGKADKVTVFADGLLIPTGIELGDGGAYVANSTEIIFLKDTKGDGKADFRRTVLSGFGTEDTHHIVHTFRWGEDGYLYFNQSIYIHSHLETPWGTKRLRGGGIWRFRPSNMELEVYCKGMCNPWGHHVDYYGQHFGTDGAGGDGIHYLVPGFTYPNYPYGGKAFPGLNPGSPKYAGMEVLSGRHLPDDWQGNIITSDFRAHRTLRFVISDDGSGFSSKLMPDFIKTRDNAYRPVDVKMGPDGAIYIADWYNPIINHGEVDFYDPRRDRSHGRIWRVTAKGRPLVERPKLVGASIKELLNQLKVPEGWTRHFAKRVLAERDPKEVVPVLAEWLKALPADTANDHHRLEALWTYQTLDIVEPVLLKQLLQSGNPNIRAAATRVAQLWNKRLPDAFELLAAQALDENPRVRLEAVRSLAVLNTPQAFEAAAKVLDKPMDRFLDHALWLTANEMRPVWMPAFEQGKITFGGDAKQAAYALRAVGSEKAVQDMIVKLATGKVPPEEEGKLLEAVGATGSVDDMTRLFETTLSKNLSDPSCAKVLETLVRTIWSRTMRPKVDPAKLSAVLEAYHSSEACTAWGLRLAGVLNMEAMRGKLEAAASAPDTPARVRRNAIDGLADLGGPVSAALLQKLAGPGNPLEIRQMAAGSLSGLDVKTAAALAADILATEKDKENGGDAIKAANGAQSMIQAFTWRVGAPEALALALAGKKIPADAAKLGIRILQSRAQLDSPLVAALNQAGSLGTERAEFSKEEMGQLIADAAAKGDPARGESLFRRKDLSCQKCHTIGGVGGQVGPDLVSIGASAPVDYIVDSLYFPNKAVKEGFNSVVAITKDGKVYTGIKVRQTQTEMVLRDANAEDISVPLANIAKQKNAGSIMPAGLMDPLTRQEVLDLVRFITELGKPGQYAASGVPLARRWQVLQSTLGAKNPNPNQAEQLAAAAAKPDAAWLPVFSEVSGILPLGDLPNQDGQSAVRCLLDVSTSGKLKLKLNNPAGLQMAIDGAGVEVKDEVQLDLKAGSHTMVFVIDRTTRHDGLRVELMDVPGAAARAQFGVGK